MVLIDSYCENSYLADQGADVPSPIRMAVSLMLIPTLTAHIEQTRCGRSTPPPTVISQIFIPTLTGHIWHTSSWQVDPLFILWELILGIAGVGDGPLHPMVILEIPALRAHIRQSRCWQMAPTQIPTMMVQIAGKAVSLHISGRCVYFNRFEYDSSSLYGRQMECVIGSFKNSYNGTKYGKQIDPTPWPNSNFRN